MIRKFTDFLKDESAATAIEYGWIVAGISVAFIAVMGTSSRARSGQSQPS
jgi:Flp pilus assembly pilin Flp